jgi:hypothetical protein
MSKVEAREQDFPAYSYKIEYHKNRRKLKEMGDRNFGKSFTQKLFSE